MELVAFGSLVDIAGDEDLWDCSDDIFIKTTTTCAVLDMCYRESRCMLATRIIHSSLRCSHIKCYRHPGGLKSVTQARCPLCVITSLSIRSSGLHNLGPSMLHTSVLSHRQHDNSNTVLTISSEPMAHAFIVKRLPPSHPGTGIQRVHNRPIKHASRGSETDRPGAAKRGVGASQRPFEKMANLIRL